MRSLTDCWLYGFVDTAFLRGRSPAQLARALCDGGANLIQLRAKGADIASVRSMALEIAGVTRPAGVGLVINDHISVALEVGAEVCHLGQEDFFGAGYTQVSQLRPDGSRLKIGLSTHGPEQAKRALAAGADYIAIGPVYATGTKPEATPVTLEYVRWAKANVAVPWFVIGGINLQRLDEVFSAGAERICVVSAILDCEDVAAAARAFKDRTLENARRRGRCAQRS